MQALPVGERAPDFQVPAVTGEQKHKLRLSDYRGQKHVVLAFHPLDWTPA
jgi:peroxiredoxin